MCENKYPSSVIIIQNITGAKIVKETHISYAIISDEYVYKIKKSVDLGFVDYKLAKSRKMYTILEKDLNDRFSKNVYLEVLKLVRKNEKDFELVPIENSLTALEYVLKMKRINDDDFLQKCIEAGLISLDNMKKIGVEIALLLKKLEVAPNDEEFESNYNVVRYNAEENFTQTASYVSKYIDEKSYNFIKDKTIAFLEKHKEIFVKRREKEFIKNGHGDLRLEHIYFNEDGTIGLIDCIEFNKRFRFNDIISEASFLSMELDSLGYTDLSDAFLKGFLSIVNDDDSLKLINYYRCYLSYVRAKVTCFLVATKDESWEDYHKKVEEIKKFINMSVIYAKSMNRESLIFYGLMGTGKTKNANAFTKHFPVALFMSDAIRKELSGLKKDDRQYLDWGTGIYSEENSLLLYNQLGKYVEEKHRVGRLSLVDASFTKKEYLQEFIKHNVGHIIFIKFDAPLDEINRRLLKRESCKTITDGRVEIAAKQRNNASMPEYDIQIITTDSIESNIEKIFEYLMK